MVQANSGASNFDADRLSEDIQEGEVKKEDVSEGDFNEDYQLAQEYSTPKSNPSGTGSNRSSEGGGEASPFNSGTGKSGSPEAFRNMAHDVQPKDDEPKQA